MRKTYCLRELARSAACRYPEQNLSFPAVHQSVAYFRYFLLAHGGSLLVSRGFACGGGIVSDLKKNRIFTALCRLDFPADGLSAPDLSIHELYLLPVFCCIFCFAGVWIRYSSGKGFSLPWLIGGGLFFSLADHTREEGNVWIVLIAAYALLILIRSIWTDKQPAGKLIRRFLFAGLILIITYEAVDLPIPFPPPICRMAAQVSRNP